MVREKRIAGIKIRDIWFDTDLFCSKSKGIQVLHTNEILNENEYDFKLGGKTFVLDISRSEEEIFSGFEYKSCRYCINKAKRDGVRVWKVENQEEIREYLAFQQSFCAEKGIPNVSASDIEGLDLFCAKSATGEFLGGCSFLKSMDGQTVRYKYGATLHKLSANEAILWEAIVHYHKSGVHYFDFGGCVPTDDKTSYYYRHYHFKKKFGGDLTESLTYFKFHGPVRLCYYIFHIVLMCFFHGDVNGLVVWLNKLGMIK